MTRRDSTSDNGTSLPKKQRNEIRSSRRTVWLKVGLGGVLALVSVGVLAALLLNQTMTVRSELTKSIDLVSELRGQAGNGDISSAEETVAELRTHISSTRAITTGPLWIAASYLPVVGSNFDAVSEATVSLDDVVERAVSPLLSEFASLNWESLAPIDGRVETDALQAAEPVISGAATTVRDSYKRLQSIDLDALVPELAAPLKDATAVLGDTATALESASSAARLLPPMLGSETPRRFLVLVQNNAETRSTGGIPGALAIIEADRGNITLGTQSSASALGEFRPALEVDEVQESIFTTRLGRHMQNVNLTPDFPTAALTAKRMWETRYGDQEIDGVLALDPVVLRYLLSVTGPVYLAEPDVLDLVRGTSLPTTLTGQNVVQTLLSDVYREIQDTSTQDAYFAAVASQIFEVLTSGRGDGTGVVEALHKAAKDHRLYLWSAHPTEQQIISGTALAGSVTGGVRGAAYGVFFNDGTGAKMDFYAVRTVQIFEECTADGSRKHRVRIEVSNSAPADAAESLPAWVTGDGNFGVEPGHIRTNYVAYGPSQALLTDVHVNDDAVPLSAARHGTRPVGTVTVELKPGESAVIDFVFSKVVQDDSPSLRVTPTIIPSNEVILPVEQMSCD